MTRIKAVIGDITEIRSNCIVNAANRSLLGGGGVDGAIHMAAGPGLLAECRTLHGCETGKAKITGAYNLPAKRIIHTVGPIWGVSHHPEEELASCYRECLRIAEENGMKSIAFPSISTGIYGFPKKKAAEIAIKEIKSFLNSEKGRKMTAIICCFDRETYGIYSKEIGNALL